MKAVISICRILVGVLFIFSGLVKLNDPLGFSYKLQEYFSEPVLDIPALIPFALIIGILLVIFELVLGIMLLIGYNRKFTVWSLLLLMMFFTFLTFYSAYFNKVTDCGCFGDAIALTPWQSFYKDVLLLILVLILFFNSKQIEPLFDPKFHKWVIFLSFMACFAFCYHVLMHLPAIDFRPYKIGNNIADLMKVPDGAQEAIYEYRWKFNKGGEEEIITNRGSYPDHPGEFIGVETLVLEKGYVPPIHDFTIEGKEGDITQEILSEEKVLLLVMYNLKATELEGLRAVKQLAEKAGNNGYRVVALTSSGKDTQNSFNKKHELTLAFYQVDETTLKTMVRANPGILVLKSGTVDQKKHWFDASDIKL